MTEEKTLEEVYRDRNLLAVAFATLVQELGVPDPDPYYSAGWTGPAPDDADAEEWAIVWARLKGDLVSWHVPRELAERSDLRRRPHDYDGHSREEKNDRLTRFFLPD